ncbi:MAG TPA: sigma-70 family RNA polymerase sigma factor, partial [Pseudoxanthomonas sp.]
MPTEFDAWFIREVLVHERALVLFLQRHWPHRDEWHDLRQEVYARVYEAAGRVRPDSPKAFLFTTARHLMTDRLRRSRVVSIEPVGDFESSNVYLIDEVSPERWAGTRQALKRLVEALDRLPDRCREVV